MDQQSVLVGLSGGVDSSVAAYLLQTEGLQCIGANIQMCSDLLPGTAASSCSNPESIEDARSVAEKLGIPFHVFQSGDGFREFVVEKFVRAYEQGSTPNPCIDCNRCLKFADLLSSAQALGCHWIATGHYAQIRQDGSSGRYLLYKAADETKDQTYFLSALTQQQLAHTKFPLGSLTKQQVRQIAQEQGFVTAHKRDSQDICFVPDGDYVAFMERYTGKKYPSGDFLDRNGRIVGKHCGAVAYTIGQRKGLGLAMGSPVYVCSKDMQANTVTVGPEEALWNRELYADNWNWFPFPALTSPIRIAAKLRSRHHEQPATAYPAENGMVRIVFDQPQRAITPGQAVVLYDGDLVVGSGTIIADPVI